MHALGRKVYCNHCAREFDWVAVFFRVLCLMVLLCLAFIASVSDLLFEITCSVLPRTSHPTHSFTHSLIHSLTHSLCQCRDSEDANYFLTMIAETFRQPHCKTRSKSVHNSANYLANK